MDVDSEEMVAFSIPPPGDEGFHESNAGGESELCAALLRVPDRCVSFLVVSRDFALKASL